MYTIPKDQTISAEIAIAAITVNEKYVPRLNKMLNYYIGVQDITTRKKEDRLKNNKVMVNHAKYISDICTSYLLGNPVDYQVGKNEDGTPLYDIQAVLDAYKKQTINDLDTEIAKDVSIYGYQHERVYANEESEPKSCSIANENVIIVYDDTVEHNKLFALIYSDLKKNGNNIASCKITYLDKNSIVDYELKNKVLTKIENSEKEHAFGDVPVICYRNNPELLGDFEPVISLIDAYNVLQSDRVNDKEQLVDAILCMYGMDFTDEQGDELRESRMLSGIPVDGKIEYLVKTLNESQVDILRQNLEKDIHKVSMVPNMSDENFASNTSGVAIRYKLLAFEQKIKSKERYMEKGLMERFTLYNNFLATNSKMQLVPVEEVDAVFKRNLPSNDLEISTMINNLSDYVDKETLIAQLSFIKNAAEIVKLKEGELENEMLQAKQFGNDLEKDNNNDGDVA